VKRIFAAVTTAIFVVLATAGCIKVDMGVTISDQDTVSGSTFFAFNSKLVEIAKQNGAGEDMFDTTSMFAAQDGITTESFSEAGYEGTKYNFKDLPLDKFFSQSDSSSFHVERQGDQLIVSGLMDTSGGSTDVDAVRNNPKTKELFDGSGIKVSITLPGQIISTNGKQDGNTITWTGEVGEVINFKAVTDTSGKVIASNPKGSSGTADADYSWVWYLVAGVVVVGGTAAFVLLRKRSN
jgi:hypothetical protein